LPPNLLNKLVLTIYGHEAHRVNLFKICDENFIVEIVRNTKPFQALPGVKIVEKGDVPDEIMFVMRGVVQFATVGYTDTHGVVDAITGYSSEGGYFGEFEYYKRTIRMVTHRAMGHCHLLSISTATLDQAIASNPLTGDRIVAEFEVRYSNFLKAAQSKALKKEGFRVYVKELIVVDGQLQDLGSHEESSKIFVSAAHPKSQQNAVRVLKEEEVDGRVVEVHAEISVDDLLDKWIIFPKLDAKIRWDIFVGVLIVYSVLIIPVQIGFDVSPSSDLKFFDHVVDSIFAVDMLLSVLTCYYDENLDCYVIIWKKIALNYIKTWFFIDFFSVVPLDTLLTGGASNSGILSSLKLLKVIRLMRLLKLARLAKLRKYLARVEDSVGINPATFELLKMILEVAFIGHLVSCMYWYTSTNLSDYSWYDKLSLRDAPLQERYITTLYWTFTTLSTVGYGDITPVDTQGRLVATVVMILGGTVFGYIVANVSSLMSSLDVSSARMNERISEVSEYLIEKNARGPLADSIVKHVKYMFTQNSAFDEPAIISRLPLHISRKMIFFQHSDTLSKIPMFAYIESRGIVLYLFRLLTPTFYDALHYICMEGTLAHEIVFIVSGRANVYKVMAEHTKLARSKRKSRSLKTVASAVAIEQCELINQLGPGDFFGHMSMMFSKPYRASVRTFMPSSVYTLRDVEIKRLVRNYPAVAITLQGALAQAIHKTSSRNKVHALLRRRDFMAGLTEEYVSSKARAAYKSKSSRDLMTNFIPRMSSREILPSADGGVSKRGTITRRMSSFLLPTKISKLPSFDNAIAESPEEAAPPQQLTEEPSPITNAPLVYIKVNPSRSSSSDQSAEDSLSPVPDSQVDLREDAKQWKEGNGLHGDSVDSLLPSQPKDSSSRYLISSFSSPKIFPVSEDAEMESKPTTSQAESKVLRAFNKTPLSKAPLSTHSLPTPINNENAEVTGVKRHWGLLRAVVLDPAAMAIISSKLTEQREEEERQKKASQSKQQRMMNAIATQIVKPKPAAPPPVRSSSSIAAVVRASIASKKRARVMLLLSGDALADIAEDPISHLQAIKELAKYRRCRSCPDFSAGKYHFHIENKPSGLKRRLSFSSYDASVVDMQRMGDYSL
jgi:CRP-like cAMP-binding protein